MPDGNPFGVGLHAVTFFADQTAQTKHELLCTLDQIAENIRKKCAPYKDDLPWLKLARFGDLRSPKNSLRHNANVLAISGVEGDYDGGPVTFDMAMECVWQARVKAVIYSTPSSTDEEPHWRILCPTSAPLPPGERTALMDRLNGLVGGGLAPESWVLSQSYYFGSIDGKPPVRVEIIDGDGFGYLDQRSDLPSIPKPGTEHKPAAASAEGEEEIPIGDVAAWIEQIPNAERSWEEWNTVLMAIYAATEGSDLGLQLAVEWSEKAEKYTVGDAEARWAHYHSSKPTRIGGGMLRRMARDQAWIAAAAEWGAFDWAASGSTGAPPPAAGEDDPTLPFLMTEADIFAMPDPVPLVEGMLMRDENICLVAAPKSGKTYLALDISLSIAANMPVLGKFAVRQPGAVVYLTAEGNAGFKRRIKAWRQARGIPVDVKLPFYFKGDVPMTAAGAAEARWYIEGIQRQLGGAPVLVVVDTMARSLGIMNENEASSAAAYLNLTEAIRSGLQTTMLTLAHASDKPGAPLQIRGSSGFGGGFDAVWGLRMDKQNRTAKMTGIYFKENDPGEFGPYCFRLKDEFVAGMENGRGAVLELVSITEWNTSGESTPQEQRCAYLRGALEAAPGQRFTTQQLAEYLVEWDTEAAFDEGNAEHRILRAKKEDFLKAGARPRARKNEEPLPGYFAAFFTESVADGASRPVRIWQLVW